MVNSNKSCIYGMLLSPDQSSELKKRAKFLLSDRDEWLFDGHLFDELRTILNGKDERYILSALSDSIKDHHCTKFFCHRENTLESLVDFEGPEVPNKMWHKNVQVAVDLLEQSLKIRPLQPIALSMDVDEDVIWSNKQASAGAIGRGSKMDNRDLCIQTALRVKREIHNGVSFSKLWIPALPFHRAQISGYVSDDGRHYDPDGLKIKDRLVWAIDGATVTVEAQYAVPLYEHLKSHWFNFAGGDDPDVLRGKISSMRLGRFWLSSDYSKFDQTIPSWLIWTCFNVIKKFFPKSCSTEIDWIAYRFINTYLILPDGSLIQKHKGIPSGSNFTQIIGTMCNMIMLLTYLASLCRGSKDDKKAWIHRQIFVPYGTVNGERDDLSCLFLGDDSLVFTQNQLDVDDLSAFVHSEFGVVIKPEKTDCGNVDSYPMFLRRIWRQGGEYRNPIDLFVNLIHNEFIRTYEDYSPIHILYGIYLTYKFSFPGYVNEFDFIEKMHKAGGLQRLQSVEPRNLPGILRAHGRRGTAYMLDRAIYYDRAWKRLRAV